MDEQNVEYDEIGIWSEVKLAIIKEYAGAYATILDKTRRTSAPSLSWIYIDAYAGPGYHLSKTTGETVEGSPLIALSDDGDEGEGRHLTPVFGEDEIKPQDIPF
jgi:three-Cys-motif partner protein